jgi:Mrp family chromosome partitioning ATPase
VLTGGPGPDDPYALLDSPQLAALLEQLKGQYDKVVLDTPALLAVADAVVLAPHVDGVVLVVGCARARGEVVQAACKQLAAAKAEVIGAVVNRVAGGRDHSYQSTPDVGGEGRKEPEPRRGLTARAERPE